MGDFLVLLSLLDKVLVGSSSNCFGRDFQISHWRSALVESNQLPHLCLVNQSPTIAQGRQYWRWKGTHLISKYIQIYAALDTITGFPAHLGSLPLSLSLSPHVCVCPLSLAPNSCWVLRSWFFGLCITQEESGPIILDDIILMASTIKAPLCSLFLVRHKQTFSCPRWASRVWFQWNPTFKVPPHHVWPSYESCNKEACF